MARRSTPSHAKKRDPREGLVFTRTIDAPRERVFRAWTDPKQFKQWWGPDGFTTPVAEMDVRPGGEMRVEMRGPDGTVYPNTGTFREVVEPERIVVTTRLLDDGGNVLIEDLNAVTFAETDGKTDLTLEAKIVDVAPEGEQYIEGMEEGWNQTLDKLVAYLESGS